MTAVEFLMEKVKRHFTTEEIIYFQDVYNQALEMEKQQMATNSSQLEISDEEIEKAAEEWEPTNKSPAPLIKMGFRSGAKWYREQLKQRK